jgi:hypothetical protein
VAFVYHRREYLRHGCGHESVTDPRKADAPRATDYEVVEKALPVDETPIDFSSAAAGKRALNLWICAFV